MKQGGKSKGSLSSAAVPLSQIRHICCKAQVSWSDQVSLPPLF